MGSSICRKLAYWLIAVLQVAALATLANALDCTQTASKYVQVCSQIFESNLTYGDKQKMISDLIYPYRDYANHSFVSQWNRQLVFDSAPVDTEEMESAYIKNAWIKIISIDPSVIQDASLLSPGTGEVLTRYNYQVRLPKSDEPGDCKTEYSLLSENSNLDVFLNGALIGHEKETGFSGPNHLDFLSQLHINAEISVSHYKIYEWCCNEGLNGCLEYCEECRFENSETRSDSLVISDRKGAEHYYPVIKHEIRPLDSYRDTIVFLLNITGFDGFELKFNDSYYRQYRYFYDVNFSSIPYDVFTIRANNFSRSESSNLNVMQQYETFKFYLSKVDGCRLKFSTHFGAWEEDCFIEQKNHSLQISTDKQIYDENETILVYLYPKETPMTISYANNKITTVNTAHVKASAGHNRITAELDGEKADVLIHVKGINYWNFLLSLALFLGVTGYIYTRIRKQAFHS